ncbi:hypothetical protein EG329_012772 [Mollisiaceae sp. DMI_Dod_QoI]|nr:hypothetical protein EG329_012772 [Helotiales sp. DMI_Dod_QoI]
MASIPSQRSRWLSRNSSQEEPASSSQAPESSSEPPSASSDTQPRPLNKPQSASTAPSESAAAQPTAAPPSLDPVQDSSAPKEIRTCWICQQDDTEDTPENNIWRAPCPCSLTAHDSCLLEWISNEEAPKPGQIASNHKIVCPQCQAEIKIQRPKDYFVSLVDKIQWAATRAMLPALGSAVIGFTYSGLLVYGMNAMTLVFGAEETKQILLEGFEEWPNEGEPTIVKYIGKFTQIADPWFPQIGIPNLPNRTLFLGVPLIGPALVLLRTSLADQVFPVLAPLYFIKKAHRTISWPPSAGLTIATIPYLRTFYNELYRQTFSSLEKEWDLAVQRKPREGETAEQIAAAAQAEVEEDNGHAIFEIEWGDEEINDDVQVEPGRLLFEAEAGDDARNIMNPNAQANEGQENEGAAPQPNPPNGNGHGNLNGQRAIQHDIDVPNVTSTVLGALFFPAISSIMGTLLKYTLPAHLTSPTAVSQAVNKGLLREKWGRTIVGGCLFVVLKDAVVLYCKWKKARDFGKRKVLDFVGDRGRTKK